jgi:hypothetical protein
MLSPYHHSLRGSTVAAGHNHRHDGGGVGDRDDDDDVMHRRAYLNSPQQQPQQQRRRQNSTGSKTSNGGTMADSELNITTFAFQAPPHTRLRHGSGRWGAISRDRRRGQRQGEGDELDTIVFEEEFAGDSRPSFSGGGGGEYRREEISGKKGQGGLL